MSIESIFKTVILLPLFIVFVVWALFSYYEPTIYSSDAVVDFFQRSLREPLFSGFLTIGAFLFSLKTFIVTIMKKNLDHLFDLN